MSFTEHADTLLRIARGSIAHGLQGNPALLPAAETVHAALRADGASFVTLKKQGTLRGCIGSLQAHRPLFVDVAENAWASAFRDPRFPGLAADEYDGLAVELSLLTTPRPLAVQSEADLLEKLRPGQDGLILQDGRLRATFLPSVWESLPDPADFVAHLKRKAGMPADHWSASLQVQIYGAEKISE